MFSRRPDIRFGRRYALIAAGAGGNVVSATDISQAAAVTIVASLDAQTTIAAAVTVDITASLSGYTPQSESTPLAWIDLQDATAITLNGGSTGVTQVKNKISGVQWDTPANDTPYEAAGLNGHPCLHPIVVGDRIMFTEAAVVSAFDCPNTTKPYTIYYVVKADSTTTGVATFGVGNTGVSSASTRTWGQRSGVATYEYAQTAPASNTVIRSTGAVTTAVNVLCWHSPGTGVHLSTNNAADDPNDAATTPSYVPGTGPNQGSLFSRPDLGPDSPAIQRFGELWVFGAEHDAAARTRVYNYLSTKWA
jgi:hypothetical protein